VSTAVGPYRPAGLFNEARYLKDASGLCPRIPGIAFAPDLIYPRLTGLAI